MTTTSDSVDIDQLSADFFFYHRKNNNRLHVPGTFRVRNGRFVLCMIKNVLSYATIDMENDASTIDFVNQNEPGKGELSALEIKLRSHEVESIGGDMNVGLLEALTKLGLAQLPDLTTFGEARNQTLSIAEENERKRRSKVRTVLEN